MRRALPILAAALLAGCHGANEPLGQGEPFVVQNATFVPGALPGHAPLAPGATPDPGPQVTDVATVSALLRQGQASHGFSGHASTDAYAIGVRLATAGSGYWLLPVAGPDPTQNGELTWSFSADVAWGAPVGTEDLLLVAFDSKGNASDQQALSVCVDSFLPDNLNACAAQLKPPATIVSLTWDSDADLDLAMTTPEGKVVSAKHPTTAQLQGSSIPAQFLPAAEKDTGYIDQDSNAACVLDNTRHEELVWQEPPDGGGTFDIQVNEFAACDATGATFTVTTYQRQVIDGGYALAATASQSGELLASQADPAAASGLYVTYVQFP